MNAIATPPVLSVALQMDDAMRTSLARDERVKAELDLWTITDNDIAAAASAAIQRNKSRITEIKAWKAGFVAPAKQIIAHAESLFDPAIEARVEFDAGLRAKLLSWDAEQKQLAAEQQRIADEAERKRRQDAEAEAARLRKKADEEAEELRKQAAEAAAAADAAKASGDAKAAAKAASQAAALEVKADAKIENADIAANATVQAASAAVAPKIAAPKIDGFSTRENWQAQLEDGVDDAQAIIRIAHAITGENRLDLVAMLALNMSNANRQAKTLKKLFNVPGMRARDVGTSVSRAA